MKINLLVVSFMALIIMGCKNGIMEAQENISNVIGTVKYDAYGTAGYVGAPHFPIGYYLINRQWITQVADTNYRVYLDGQLDATYLSNKVSVEGVASTKTVLGTFGPEYYINLSIVKIIRLNE
jgi:hypothetical protein